MSSAVNFAFVTSIPGAPAPNTLYFLKTGANTFTLVDTDGSGTEYDLVAASTMAVPYQDFEIQSSNPAPPLAGEYRFYPKTGGFYFEDSTGTVTAIGGGSSGVSSLEPVGGTPITGAVELQNGAGLTLSQAGQIIMIALTDTGVAPGTYGDATHVPQITFNSKGQATSVTLVPISGSGGGSAADQLWAFFQG